MSNKNKEIIALTDFEHCLARPTMYIGSVEKSEEKVQIVQPGKIIEQKKIISVGFYKMLNEIVDNAFDEAKRMNGKMKKIVVRINSKSNEVQVIDTGGGFINAEKTNSKTNVTNVETAMSMLRAGSNFYNDQSEETLIGTNGVGAALVNMLSDSFTIKTVNEEIEYVIEWTQFVKKREQTQPRDEKESTGTTVTYIPRKDIFKDCTWDREYLHSMFIFREYLKNHDPAIKNLDIEFYFDEELMDLKINFLPSDAILIPTKLGIFAAWPKYEGCGSVSFINGANCVGIHQKIFTDWVDEIFKYHHAYHFYETMIILNFPPKLVRFGDQNKTKYVGGRWEIQELLEKTFFKHLSYHIPRSEFYTKVSKLIEQHVRSQELKTLKQKKKAATKKISDKYFPPSQSKGTLFIVEGSCIQENTLINVWRDGEPMTLEMKDLCADDEVITHNNRFRRILTVQKKLKHTQKITTIHGEVLTQSSVHRYYIYNKETKEFEFLKVKDIVPGKHLLVKSRLHTFIGTVSVFERHTQSGKYSECFLLEDGKIMQNTPDHSYAVFDLDSQSFMMKKSKDIVKGDHIGLFN